MDRDELILEMKQFERRLPLHEEKYGILSQDFYDLLSAGRLLRYDDFDETRANFICWKGVYEPWRRRKTAYGEQIKHRDPATVLRVQPAY